MSKQITLVYYARIAQEKDGYIVTFRDLPNVFTEGDTFEEALGNAQEALDGVLAEMVKSDITIPYPSKKASREYPVQVSPEVAAPILLYLLRRERRQTVTQVAKTMQIPYQQYQRLEHMSNMTLKSLKRAVAAMGGRVELKLYVTD